MEKLVLGGVYHRVADKPEGVFFDIQYPHIELIYNISLPTGEEIDQTGEGHQFDMRVAEVNGLLFVMTKFGDLHWQDAPYNPQLGNSELDELTDDTQGYLIQFFMTEVGSGVIRRMRMLGLGHDFSKKLRAMVYANKAQNIPLEEYDRRLQRIYASYPTKALVDASTIRYRLKEVTNV